VISRDDLLLRLEIALVDWKGHAQPHELTELSELLLDAKDADEQTELDRIDEQFRGLERFVASRKASSSTFVPPKR
jgi:hypothetical protein